MQTKLILTLLATLCIVSGAAVEAGACADGAKYDTVAGICVYCPLLCSTCDGSGACLTCDTTNGFELSGSDCVCAALTPDLWFDSNVPKCRAAATATAACEKGFGEVLHTTDKLKCVPCAKTGCNNCETAAGAAAAVNAECTSCMSGEAVASAECPLAASGQAGVIETRGVVATIPAGYFISNATTKQISPCGMAALECTAANAHTKCVVGYVLNASNICTAITAGDCDATCATDKCQTTVKSCTECAADHWQVKAFGVAENCVAKTTWTNSIIGCTEAEDGNTEECKTCGTGLTLSDDKKVCDCTDKTKGYKITAYVAADANSDPAVVEQAQGVFCTACATACADGKECRASADHTSVSCKDKPAPPVETPDCEDAALKKAGCKTCAKEDGAETYTCSACLTGFAALDSNKNCPCDNTKTQAMYVDASSIGRCKECATACDEGKFCKIKEDGTDDECSATAATTDDATTGDSANILTAALAILAIILA